MKKLLMFLCVEMAMTSFLYAQNVIIKLTTTKKTGSEITFYTTHTERGSVSIDWGDGKYVSLNTDAQKTLSPLKGIVKGSTITVKLSRLHTFSCENSEISKIDLSNAKNLRSLFCQNNKLTALNLEKMTALENLNCANNQIANFTFTNNDKPELDLKSIKNLNFSHNKFTRRYAINFSKLEVLKLNNNSLRTITIDAPNLRYLDISYNGLTSLSLETPLINNIICIGNNLSGIYFHDHCEALTQLICDNNNLTEISISPANNLIDLSCSNNKLTSLVLSKNAKLRTMNISNNKLTLSCLPSKENKPNFTSCSPQEIVNISKVEGMLSDGDVVYAPLAANWEERNNKYINLAPYMQLSDGSFDADCSWFSVANNTETPMKKCSTTTDGDFAEENGKVSFFKAQEDAYAVIKSKTYDLTLTTSHIVIKDDLSSIYDNEMDSKLTVSVEDGMLKIETAEEMPVSIHSVVGTLVWQQNVNGTCTISLPKGLYLVNNKKIIL